MRFRKSKAERFVEKCMKKWRRDRDEKWKAMGLGWWGRRRMRKHCIEAALKAIEENPRAALGLEPLHELRDDDPELHRELTGEGGP